MNNPMLDCLTEAQLATLESEIKKEQRRRGEHIMMQCPHCDKPITLSTVHRELVGRNGTLFGLKLSEVATMVTWLKTQGMTVADLGREPWRREL